MENNSKQRLRLLYLYRIFWELTDDSHGLTREQLAASLEAYGIKVERKTLYHDIELLRDYGVDIIRNQEGRQSYYHIGSRLFELPELKLLVDLVQASRFITKKKSEVLISKLEQMASVYEGHQLNRQVFVAGRVKAENESIYYVVDRIYSAINANQMVSFHYFRWTKDKKKELRHRGKKYNVSPWALSWDHEKYYLIGYDNDIGDIRHYRVDKIINLELMDKQRKGLKAFENYDMVSYTNKIFGMFDGESTLVTLQYSADMVGVIIDQFGTDIPIKQLSEDLYQSEVEVAVSAQFLGWVLALGDSVKIAGPEDVVDQMRELLAERTKLYKTK